MSINSRKCDIDRLLRYYNEFGHKLHVHEICSDSLQTPEEDSAWNNLLAPGFRLLSDS